VHKIDIPAWARHRARNPLQQLAPERTALLVIDMQSAFVDLPPMGNPFAAEIIPNINRLCAAVRGAGGVVAFTRHTVSDQPRFRLSDWELKMVPRHPDGALFFTVGSHGHELHRDLDVLPQDIVIDKHRFSAFMPNSSDLHEALQGRGVDTLIVTGTVTNVCCETTARDAHMLGYKIVFVSDANAALSDEEHNASLLNMTTIFGEVRDTAGTIELITRQHAASTE
jgi:ureidoacrylate peracid hydrolase